MQATWYAIAGEIVNTGVDYVTLSYRAKMPSLGNKDALWRRLQAICNKQDVPRDKVKEASLYGYAGIRYGSAFVGYDRVRERRLEIVSGQLAQSYDLARECVDVKVSRLDLQATLMLRWSDRLADAASDVEDEITIILRHLKDWRQYGPSWARRVRLAQVTSTDGGMQGTTLYIGSRTSQVMARIYNKTAESQVVNPATMQYPSLLRVEIELKQAYAAQARNELLRLPEYKTVVLRDLVGRYGLELPILGKPEKAIAIQAQLTSRSNDRTLNWLATSVASSIARLVAEGVDKEHIERLLWAKTLDEDSDTQ